MSHLIIPAPARLDEGDGQLAIWPGTPVAYTDTRLVSIVERSCSEIARRTGVRVAPRVGTPRSGEPSIRIELAHGNELGALAAPLGVSPTGHSHPDERHSLVIDERQVVLCAVDPIGVARGLSTLIQLLAATPPTVAGTVAVPAMRILDAPRYAWRGLSLDVARTFFTLDDLRRMIDLLELYKLNVLHLHLTEDQAWRLPVGRPAEDPESDVTHYTGEELRALTAYADERFVTVVPEVDTPGHAHALVRMHPALDTHRNVVEFEFPPGRPYRTAWLDPDLPATFDVVEEVLAGVAAMFPSPYIHIGGDEAFGMAPDAYRTYVRRVRAFVRSIGKRPIGWQESARAGLGPDDVIQCWIVDAPVPTSLPPEFREHVEANIAMSRGDVERAVAASAPVIVSPWTHCYLDVPYAEPSADHGQAERASRVGLRFYPARTVAEAFDWDPSEALGPARAEHVGGVEAAVWAETIADFDDLSFLLLPRLAGVAHKAWSDPQVATWTDHRDGLARHGRLWAQDGLTYFRSSMVDWR